ncbi:peptide chain release factor N(5)-glutamine methyltransferase [Lachnoclostridium phytofermentans]|uniref:Release factor glutamine methyltransferase n=1 Tax=Lachnoclostridium phytofermentans (strain ATCC 700394 / DSM 18823 / ISDg) TaxID=357809 RepID=A9KHD3_LACP7|nr:peptide chain release factor N(5)-glutamine methyltransferase [Lachnoclostridium phytofermentans]ABX40800.1 protein-(glutamine-N5) methyltransferase, release factor-specific [Lachnoclostridium phytofermentans ISDg]
MSKITYESALREGCTLLQASSIQDAELDAWYLLEHVTGLRRIDYMIRAKEDMSIEVYERYQQLLKKRALHIPLQYLTGSQEFMGLSFRVNESVLIPRQDTERLVEEVLKVSKDKDVLELCTGSGCIIISLAKLGNIKNAVAVDISSDAIKVAKENAKDNEVLVTYLLSDMFSNVSGTYDVIVSNPPYIESEVIEGLMPEVKDHEPRIALDGDADGLKFYRILAKESGRFLNKNGRLYLEIGCNQAAFIGELLSQNGFAQIKVVKDYAGLDRVVSAVYEG